MTEAEWLACDDPEEMIPRLGRKASKRKRRLFGCACCRRVWPLISDERSRAAVDAAEKFADGLLTANELELAERDARKAVHEHPDADCGMHAAWASARVTVVHAGSAIDGWEAVMWAKALKCADERGTNPECSDFKSVIFEAEEAERSEQAKLLRDIFGNPYRSVTIDPEWGTSTVVALARQMYDSRDFSLMPILADALQDAGCENADILAHCRGDGPHVRGCWVCDLILVKQ